MGELFQLRGELSKRQSFVLGIGGILFLLFVWYLLTMGDDPMIEAGIFPKPLDVLTSYKELFQKNELLRNLCLSLGYNFAGYFEAMLISIPVGFAIGLIPFFRGAFQRPVDALRYVPLPAAIGLFIAWFGIGTGLKVHFLAFGILIYLIPVVVQRIDEVKSVYLKTVYTLGATDWQTIKSVYFPSVMSRLSDDIRVLTAISWTYIIIAESIGGEGGLGKIIWSVGQRRGRVDVVFALLILIIMIGILQDRLFVHLDKKFFSFKFQDKPKARTILTDIGSYAVEVLVLIFLLGYGALWFQSLTAGPEDVDILNYLFADTIWVFHVIFILVLFYKLLGLYNRFIKKPKLVKAT